MSSSAVDDQERRIREIFDDLNERPRLSLRISMEDADAFAVAAILRRKAADIHDLWRFLSTVGLSFEDWRR